MFLGKNLVISGASSGIGRDITIVCNALNANIVIIGRNLTELEITRMQCRNPDRVKIVQGDLSGDFQIEDAIVKTLNLNEINGIVHSAGVSHTVPLKQHSSHIFENTLSVNLFGGIKLISELNDYLLPHSSIVFISSVMSSAGQKAKHSYCASKGGVDAAVRCMALEFALRRIRVNSILPGVVETSLATLLFTKLSQDSLDEIMIKHPLGLGRISDVTGIVVFLLSEFSQNISGQSIVVDGGYLAQ